MRQNPAQGRTQNDTGDSNNQRNPKSINQFRGHVCVLQVLGGVGDLTCPIDHYFKAASQTQQSEKVGTGRDLKVGFMGVSGVMTITLFVEELHLGLLMVVAIAH
ncbi:MAG: hypothetical protein F6K19_05090 [Cyanothece sp. SIO1E1]|nr:hypothetical protein [Cyanothece sp. SIO1E1]